jgi:hypothetical protein
MYDKGKKWLPELFYCKYFSNGVPWYGTKHRIKRARAEGKISKGDERDVGKDFHPINYAKRGKNKNVKQR